MNHVSICYNFKRASFPALYALLSEIDWSFLKDVHDVNDACNRISNTLRSVYT